METGLLTRNLKAEKVGERVGNVAIEGRTVSRRRKKGKGERS
jgi:hypothetical protein